MILPFLTLYISMAFLTEEQEEIREAIWQKHKTEENAIIREIEEARRV